MADGTAPASAIACEGGGCSAGWYSGPVSVSLSATDAASGLAEIRYTTDGSDPTPTSGTVYSGPFSVASTTTVRFRAYDEVGNEEPVGSQTILIDQQAPTVSLADPGSLLSGTVFLSATANDASSGVASVRFEISQADMDSWTEISTDPSAPFTANLDASALADGAYDLRAVAADVAGNSIASDVLTSKVDTTGPTVTLVDPGAAVHGTVALSANAVDTVSGVASVAYEYAPAGSGTWASTPAAWDTTGLTEGPYDLRARATDNAGNESISPTVSVSVDNTAPTAFMDDPGSPLNGIVTLSGHTSDLGSGVASQTFQYTPSGAVGWVTIPSADWDTSTVPEGRYDLRVVVTDGAGNVTVSNPVPNRAVSNAGVSVTIVSPGDYVSSLDSNPFTIEATSADAADLSDVKFFACDNTSFGCATGNWVLLGSDSTEPYTASWAVSADGSRALRAVATSTSNAQGTDILNVLVDRTAPAGGSVSYANEFPTGPVPITATRARMLAMASTSPRRLIQRDEGTLAGGSCSFTGAGEIISSPDSTLTNGHLQLLTGTASPISRRQRALLPPRPTPSRPIPAHPRSRSATPAPTRYGTVGLMPPPPTPSRGVDRRASSARRPARPRDGRIPPTQQRSLRGEPSILISVADGLYDLRAIATDAAGNLDDFHGAVTDRRVDNTAPEPELSTAPAEGARVSGSLPLGSQRQGHG